MLNGDSHWWQPRRRLSNDDVRFDRGAITIEDDGTIIGASGSSEGRLRKANGHCIDLVHLNNCEIDGVTYGTYEGVTE